MSKNITNILKSLSICLLCKSGQKFCQNGIGQNNEWNEWKYLNANKCKFMLKSTDFIWIVSPFANSVRIKWNCLFLKGRLLTVPFGQIKRQCDWNVLMLSLKLSNSVTVRFLHTISGFNLDLCDIKTVRLMTKEWSEAVVRGKPVMCKWKNIAVTVRFYAVSSFSHRKKIDSAAE